jgi:hypothetical protein
MPDPHDETYSGRLLSLPCFQVTIWSTDRIQRTVKRHHHTPSVLRISARKHFNLISISFNHHINGYRGLGLGSLYTKHGTAFTLSISRSVSSSSIASLSCWRKCNEWCTLQSCTVLSIEQIALNKWYRNQVFRLPFTSLSTDLEWTAHKHNKRERSFHTDIEMANCFISNISL